MGNNRERTDVCHRETGFLLRRFVITRISLSQNKKTVVFRVLPVRDSQSEVFGGNRSTSRACEKGASHEA